MGRLSGLSLKKLQYNKNSQPFSFLVDQILTAKKKDLDADTSALEKKIDDIVYKLYDLTPERLRLWRGRGKIKQGN